MHRSLRRSTVVLALPSAAALLATGLAAALVIPVASAGATRSRAPGTGLAFSHAVVVDEQRPGFEPDVKVGSNGVIFTSMPFGFSTTQSFVWSSHDHGNSYQFVPGTVGPGKPSTCVGGG